GTPDSAMTTRSQPPAHLSFDAPAFIRSKRTSESSIGAAAGATGEAADVIVVVLTGGAVGEMPVTSPGVSVTRRVAPSARTRYVACLVRLTVKRVTLPAGLLQP